MYTSEAINLFTDQVVATPLLEWIAIAAAIAEVLYARANKVWLYPAGIISTAIYTWLFCRPTIRLYADALLNTYYFAMSIYGWALWSKNNGTTPLPVTKADRKDWVMIVTFVAAGWLCLYLLLTRVFPAIFNGYIISDVAGFDALISSAAWVGMWLLVRRKIENWLLLNVSNIIAVPILLYKEMPFTAALTLFLFIVAIFGYLEWKKIYRLQSSTVSSL
ncbi:MAG: nicotinamide mononucleotide transporter [Taibaiella sp.]|nr:nicotinamide mononucleotide transporter [Taibaiella sp.]